MGTTEHFEIEAAIGDKRQKIQVDMAETTDGVPYYKCSTSGKELTQIRKEDQRWTQIWGELPEAEVTAIGKLIDAYLDQDKIVS